MDDTQNEKTTKSSAEDHVIESDDELNYKKIHDEFPDTFEGFGYKFNEFGQLRHITTGESFEFNVKKDDQAYNQKRYEALGELDANADEPTTFIFHSDDAFTNEKIVILIHGSGVVRAGQWARRLIINDSLNSGTQLPYIKRAKGLGYGVIVLNTNDNRRIVRDGFRRIRGSDTPENHANYVWKNIIIPKTAAKYIAIVAHSYGGIVTVNMCRSFPESFQKRVFAIAFTDSPHSLVNQGLSQPVIEWFRKVARNWVFSNLPLDTFLSTEDSYEVECVSAGTQRHDLTSWMSFASVYEFIDSRYRKTLSGNEL
ncbi:unnamed protein product [Larinioides sclopetarius]|uniref:Arb2 domain-containing protein n=1 Tax=Larinioides sclopetarius TaxID=280406 RepID=A0AAV1ZD91_9ARAC